MKAELIARFRNVSAEGDGIELVVWRLAKPLSSSMHPYKYRLVYLEGGQRVVGFDNERGKGDHKHVGAAEFPYRFVDVDRLIDDFRIEVERWKER